MAQTTFHWKLSDITPELLMAVGAVTLNWAQADNSITQILQIFWANDRPNERMPRSFDKRVDNLVEFVEPLLASEPDELRVFRWYIQRLRDANGKRDSISHGIPGTITKNGRTFQGLMVPHPSKRTIHIPLPPDDISDVAKTIGGLWEETIIGVYPALIALWQAASGNIRTRQSPDEWKQVTMDNRSPRLPRSCPPPPTFQG